MKRYYLSLSVAFGMTMLIACSGATQTCTATGLTPGTVYAFSFVHDGTEYSGEFLAEGSSQNIPNIPSSVDCSSINLERYVGPLIAMEAPPVN